MTDLLRRTQAPLTDAAWQEIDETAARLLKVHLVARGIIEVDGPHGWDLAAVNLGRLRVADQAGPGNVPWGTRDVLPLIELRVPFELDQMELDYVARGAKDVELGSLTEAAKKAALFEEHVIYHGLPSAAIDGILKRSDQTTLALPPQPQEIPRAVAEGIQHLHAAGIPGPYFLLLGQEPFLQLKAHACGAVSPNRMVHDLIDGTICYAPALQGGLLLSAASGQFELTIGQDWSVGYAAHDRNKMELYLTESFAFRVLEPAAAVQLTSNA
jgi:uncharacterized linocin/CFP29 family protein